LLFFEFMDTFLTAGIYGVPAIKIFGFELGSAKTLFIAVWIIVILCYIGSRSMLTSRFGRALAALRDDPLAASSTGVNLARIKITVFAISAALGGLAGALFAPYQASVTDSSFGFFLSVNLLMMVIIGGMRSPAGPIVGALFLVIVPEFGRQWEEYRLFGYGIVLVAVIVLFPGGITSLGNRILHRSAPAEPSSGAGLGDTAPDRAGEPEDETASSDGQIDPVLSAAGIYKRFGGLEALVDVDLMVYPGEIHALIGPNGAGKTTLFNCVSGVDTPDSGTVELGGRPMTGEPAHAYARQGLMRTFQHARIFGGLSVLENVMVGSHSSMTTGALRGMFRTPGARKEERATIGRARGHLDAVGLLELAGRPAGELTLAEERRLEIARCLAGDPSVLLFDEPAAGLGDAEAAELGELIRRISRRQNIGVVLIEHHLEMALELASRVTVLNFGEVIARGTPEEVRADDAVVAAYIGTAA
jgi:branched-chain amino acid transport system permease protein